MKLKGALGFAKPISLVLAWKWVIQKSRKAMNGEENSSLLRTLCTASQKGKQDLVFTGVILGNREIDCQIFILSECVCQLAAIVC